MLAGADSRRSRTREGRRQSNFRASGFAIGNTRVAEACASKARRRRRKRHARRDAHDFQAAGSGYSELTDDVVKALEELKPLLPPDIRINTNVYQQKTFIDLSIQNVIEALRGRRHIGRHHPVSLLAELPYDVHHPDG